MAGSSSRMLALLSLLQTRRDWPGQVLAERLAVTPRTVRRDVERLRDLGYRIASSKGPDGGYRLAAGSELPPLLFDDEQAVAVALALRSAPATGVELEEAAARALATVRQVMPSRLRHRVDGVRFLADRPTTPAVDPATVEVVTAAVHDHRVLTFDYEASDGRTDRQGPPRRTHPHAVVARQGRWYLVAWDVGRSDWRTFRLDRMRPRTPAGPVFAPRPLPLGDAQAFLAARSKGSDTGPAWPCVGRVDLDLPAPEVRPWVLDGQVDELGDGRCRLTVGSWSWVGVLAFVVRFEAPFRVVGPDALIEAAAGLARRLDAAAVRW